MLDRRLRGTVLALVLGCLGLLLPPEALSAATPYLCHRVSTPKFLDGRLSDWPEPHFALDRWHWRAEPNVKPVYGGPLDLSATVRLAWDDANLYIAVVVVDDLFMSAKEGPLDAGDAVVLRLAPADAPRETPCVPVELVITFRELAVAHLRGPNGELAPAAGVKLGAARASLPLPAQPLPAEAGKSPAPHISKLWYELAVPWTLLPQVTPVNEARMGLEVQILDYDGGALRGRLRWRGITGAPRTATDFGCVQLAPPRGAPQPAPISSP